MKNYIKILLLLFSMSSLAQNKTYTISGHIYEKGSKESLVGVNIYIPSISSGTTTNNYGFYSLTVPKGIHSVYYSYIGFSTIQKDINLDKSQRININMKLDNELETVVIVSNKNKKISKQAQMSKIDLPVSQIKNIPSLLGEKDVLKALQLMPGVQSGSEGSSGIYVRGGGPDQNLVILDNAPVYNASHLFGFFSVFNGDAIKSVSLIKGGFPAQYGGRLSSVLEMTMKEGNKEKLSGEVGIGLISSRATLEGPIIKGKSSFLVSGRRTYLDVLTKPFMPKGQKAGYFFYDFNAKTNYDFNDNDKIYLSGYFGQDKFKVNFSDEENSHESGMNWGNKTGTFRWNHLFTDKTFSNTSLIFSDYLFEIYDVSENEGDKYELTYNSGIRDLGIKYDIQYSYSPKYTLKAGLASTLHKFTPSAIVVKGEVQSAELKEKAKNINTINTIESGLYIENKLKFWNKLRMNAGLRLNHYHHENKSYIKPEPRFSGNYSFTNDFSIKASYAKMNQFVHLLSSTGISLPLDLWVPSTDIVKPQNSEQFALGLAKDLTKANLTLSLEVYYKKMNNIIGYKPGANFMLIDDLENSNDYSWEESIIRGKGWSYGTEFLLQRKTGKLSGWLGYTLSWTEHQFDQDNGGEKYFAKYDRRHDISVVTIYKISDKITLSGTWVYGTGNNVNLPTQEYENEIPKETLYNYSFIQDYGKKNSTRMEAYHRLDLGIQFHKKRENYERTWDLSFYNAYSRSNPFIYRVEREQVSQNNNGKRPKYKNKLMKVSLFPIVPSISYNIKF